VGLWSADDSASHSPFITTSKNVQICHGTIEQAIKTFTPTIIHDNGIWLQHHHAATTLSRRYDTPRIVSTRGMLLGWARKHKRFKKFIAWHLYQRRDLSNADILHATSEAEATELRRLVPHANICCIPNGIDFCEETHGQSCKTMKTLLFVGRLYPVKGLPMLIEAWNTIRPADWTLRIVGPDSTGHSELLRNMIAKWHLHDAIDLAGERVGDELDREYRSASALVLPSYSENFGMVVGEAMAYGLPVITTQGTPWESLVKINAGWWVPPTVEGITNALRELTSRSRESLAEMGKRGRQLAEREFGWNKVANDFLKVYLGLLNSRNRGR
jgi:glycosyltransferase involved in cell wall biosynthesis